MFRILLILALLAQQQPPTFRGGINLITLDITATGPDGWPVRDLRRDEITLIVNGRERPLKSFELMEVAPPVPAKSATPSAAAPSPAKDVAAPASNVGTPGRSVFFVIMHEQRAPGARRRDGLHRSARAARSCRSDYDAAGARRGRPYSRSCDGQGAAVEDCRACRSTDG